MGNWRSQPAPRPPSPADSENLTAKQIGDNGLFIGVSMGWTRFTIVILDERWRGNIKKVQNCPAHMFHIREKSYAMSMQDRFRLIVLAVLGNLHRLLSGRYRERVIKKIVICHDYDIILDRLQPHFEPCRHLPRFQGRFTDVEVYYCRVYQMYYDLIFDYHKNPKDRLKRYNTKFHRSLQASNSLQVNGILYWDAAIWFMHATHPAEFTEELRRTRHEREEVVNEHWRCGDEGSAHWTGKRIIERVVRQMPPDYYGEDCQLQSELRNYFDLPWHRVLDYLHDGGLNHREIAGFTDSVGYRQWTTKPWRLSNIEDEADNVVVQEYREAAKIILNNYLKRCLTKDSQKATIVILGDIGYYFKRLLPEIPRLDIDSEASIKLFTIDQLTRSLLEAARAAALLASYGPDDKEPLVPITRCLEYTFHWHK